MCSVYLDPSSTDASHGFRLENGIKPNVLDPVRVAIDKRGNRWIEAVLNPPTGGFLDVRNKTALLDLFWPGMIVGWNGTIASIPAGWKLCDGANGTPDLRDKMILGEGTTAGSGGTVSPSGALTAHTNHTVTQPSAHTVTQPSNHTVTQPNTHATHADHAHETTARWDSGDQALYMTTAIFGMGTIRGSLGGTGGIGALGGATPMALTSGVTASQSHDAHSGTAVSAHTGTAVSAHAGTAVDAHSAHAVYKHYKLFFIMKV